MKKTLLILLLFITSTAQAERRTVKVVDRAPPRKALTDVNGHLMVEHSGIKIDVGGHLIVEATGIKTIFAEYWPPPITQTDNEANLLIVKAFGLLVSYGQIKLKKPLLTPEQRAERARRLLESGSGFIDSNNSPDRTSGKAEVEASDERK